MVDGTRTPQSASSLVTGLARLGCTTRLAHLVGAYRVGAVLTCENAEIEGPL